MSQPCIISHHLLNVVTSETISAKGGEERVGEEREGEGEEGEGGGGRGNVPKHYMIAKYFFGNKF